MPIVNSAIDGMIPEFDPTNPDADYGDMVRVGGDAALNAITGGAAGNIFSQGSQGIEDLNEFTDNAFTAESLGEAAEVFVPVAEEVTEQVTEVASNVIENVFGGLF
jgi:hypothetical protein